MWVSLPERYGCIEGTARSAEDVAVAVVRAAAPALVREVVEGHRVTGSVGVDPEVRCALGQEGVPVPERDLRVPSTSGRPTLQFVTPRGSSVDGR